MECCSLTACGVSAAVLFVLFYWIWPAMQRNAFLTLTWYDFLTERLNDKLSGTTRPQRILKAVQKNGTKGDPESIISAIDNYCRHSEWAMNVGDEKVRPAST